jgi:phage tail sheath protein FI
MTESTFPISPGVVANETDLSGPTKVSPSGIPAGVIGTAVRGPAFVPITVATFQDFISTFGNSDGLKFGPMTMREWLRNAGAGTFVRVLGAGDGSARSTSGNNLGRVARAGFVVGQRLPQANGNVGDNADAGAVSSGAPGTLGRTYMLAAIMSESAGSRYLSDAGIQNSATSHPVLRGVLMAPSGVMAALSHSLDAAGAGNMVPATNAAAYTSWGAGANAGGNIGSVNIANSKQEFVLLLNGHKNNATYKNVITASFDPSVSNYFVNVFNTDPLKVEEAGHYLYAHYDVDPALAVLTGSGITSAQTVFNSLEPLALLLTSSLARDVGNATSTTVGVPNFENFEDRFEPAFSPFVISQKFGGSNKNLFRFYTLSDGLIGAGEFKITIENIAASAKANNKFGKFDVLVRRFMDNDRNPTVLEAFRGLTLDPTDDNYIAKRIGDQNTYFDFDAAVGNQKIVVEGDYANASSFIRVELSSDLKNGRMNPTALPTGFRGLYHLVTSGTSVTGGGSILTGSATDVASNAAAISVDAIKRVVQLPVPMREWVSTGAAGSRQKLQALTWGIQFEVKDSIDLPNKNEKLDTSLLSFTKFFPRFQTSWQNAVVGDNAGAADVGGCILDADRFNNNIFSLERVQVITGSNDRPDPQLWSQAQYRRTGVQSGSLPNRENTPVTNVRFLDATKDFAHVPSRKWLKFTFPLQGGHDGVNIFDREKSKFSDSAIRREMDDSSEQGGKSGPTVSAFRKAVDVMEAKQDVDIQLLAIPGIRHPSVTDYTVESVERRFDALYLMDIEAKDKVDSFVTSSLQVINVGNTISAFQSRAVDSSFAAAYFPDVVIEDSTTQTNVVAPASAVVLGALALNDAIGHPWFAPAGFSRGALQTGLYTTVALGQENRDDLYSADINPIIDNHPSQAGVVVWGQKTLLAAQSALDRVNVRRLLIDVRRKVRDVARTFLFEPNQASTIAAFSAQVQPILASIQSQGGLDRFKVKIDASTTTQADVENNTIRGRIYLQPTKSIEFVSLDFVVSNDL